jgi:hypothetical protein
VAFPTIAIGLALVLIGLQGYFDFGGLLGVAERSPTALIPAAVGAVLAICGALSLDDRLRKHVMHFAAAVGLLGFLGAIWRPAKALVQTGTVDLSAVAVRLQLATAALCLLFVILCVRSFVAARRARPGRDARTPGGS